jgi:D-2-hydroxyacid dehydrogenase (NADP+)
MGQKAMYRKVWIARSQSAPSFDSSLSIEGWWGDGILVPAEVNKWLSCRVTGIGLGLEEEMMTTVLLGLKKEELQPTQVQRLYDLVGEMRVLITRDRDEMENVLDDVEIAAGSVPVDLLLNAPNLRWYQQWGAGADWLMRHPEAVEQDWVLTNVSGIHAIPISEHIFAFLLAFARRLPGQWRARARREWYSPGLVGVSELYAKTALIIGLGPIGVRTAELATAFGMRVLGVRRDPTIGVPGIERIVAPSQLGDVLPEADFVIVTVPLTAETQGMFTVREFRLMKPSAILVNIGRGGTIVEDDLVDALKTGLIAGAGLDVFETEPLPEDSQLWDLDNVIITSHYAGATPLYHSRAMDIFVDNVGRYQSGEPLRNVVDKQLGY